MLTDRVVGVFKLDVNTFESIEHDTGATSQAAIVVAIVAVLAAIGAGGSAALAGNVFFPAFISALIWTFLGWLLWSVISYFVGTSLFGGTATVEEMLRVIGFAYAPQMLAIIPCIGGLIGAIWSLIAGFIAIRQGLDIDSTRAFFTVIIGFIAYVIGTAIINLLFAGIGGVFG